LENNRMELGQLICPSLRRLAIQKLEKLIFADSF
jgi:hypothetical protein